MLFLIPNGWINGLTGSVSFFFGCILGLSIIYQARKITPKLLLIMGINILIAAFLWFAFLLDFFNIVFTGYNIVIPNGGLGIIYFVWSPLAFLLSLYIGAELFFPDKKYYVIMPFLILGVIYELIIFINPMGSFTFNYPPTSGYNLIDVSFTEFSPAFLINYFFVISALIFCGFGYLYKGLRSKDVIRKRFFSLSIGYLLFVGFPIVVVVVDLVEPYTYIARIGMIIGFLFFYFGLREVAMKKIKERERKKDIKLEESLFRFYQRPESITEEEISYYKEKKICLVCKGDLSRLNYICPKCSTLYCTNCSEQLSELENMCWVCDEPFDETKPVRPYERKRPKEVEAPGKD